MSYPSTPDPDPAPSLVTIGRAAKKATLGARTQVIVPVCGDAHSLSEQVGALASCSADIVEWRADTYLASLVGSHFVAASEVADDLVRMARYVADASPLPVLATIRTSVEGGEAFLDDEEYCALVADLAPLVGGVDVEISRDGAHTLIERVHAAGAVAVASFHDFEATPADEVLEEVLARMAREGADLAKIAVWPTSADDVARLLGVCARATAGAGTGLGVPVAAMSMGALGAVSRVAPAFGTALTFAVVPDGQGQSRASAPGQLPLQDVRRCLELLRA